MTTEMREQIWAMMEAANYDPETACEGCPFAGRCDTEELFWGCAVWEDQMGEDL